MLVLMGMYDNVYDQGKPLVLKCPKCASEVTGFQSKSGPREMANVDWRLLPNFYSSCANCGHWVELRVEPPVFTLRMMLLDDNDDEVECLREEIVRLKLEHLVVPATSSLNVDHRVVAVPELTYTSTRLL